VRARVSACLRILCCVAEAKTAPARRTLDPLYQQQLTFREDYRQCILQVSVAQPAASTRPTSRTPLTANPQPKPKLKPNRQPTTDNRQQQQQPAHQTQIIVWGDYGRMNHKALMGIVQIQLDDLNLSTIVIGWYKLFNPSSITSLPSKSLRHSMLSSSTQSFT